MRHHRKPRPCEHRASFDGICLFCRQPDPLVPAWYTPHPTKGASK